jgi:hypothetical protein
MELGEECPQQREKVEVSQFQVSREMNFLDLIIFSLNPFLKVEVDISSERISILREKIGDSSVFKIYS